ncbi:hypothetical protein ACHAW5_007354 [Stephanodiscus triporus]|uniref:Major facilitator superfamily (MFS) profile domain-containing protein n=1 Tax=Stephanodiscus triporus TaxID=2934178 RepID=A0ABD3NV84_9STRA
MGDRFQPLSVVDDDDGCAKRPPRSIDDYLDSAYRRGDGIGPSSGLLRRRPSPPLRRLIDGVRARWRYHVIFLALGIANSGDSAEIACTSFALSSSTFQRDVLVGGDFEVRGSAIAGAHFAGMFLSGLLAGPLADSRGRRSTVLLGLISNSVVGVLSSCARTAYQLFVLRFATGMGLGMVIGGVVALAAELSPPAARGRYMTLVSSCYTLGFLYTSFWALLIFRGDEENEIEIENENDGGGGGGPGNWRWFMFVNALPTMVAAILVAAFVPESPRFYLCRGRLVEAVRVANAIAGSMGRDDDDDDDDEREDDLLTEGELRRYMHEAGTDGHRCGGDEAIGSMRYNEAAAVAEVGGGEQRRDICWRDFRTSLANFERVFGDGYWKTTIPLQLCYFSLTLVTGVATWWTKIFQNLELQSNAYALSFYHTLSQIPGMMLATCLIDLVGRRRLIIVGFGGGSFTLILLSAMANAIQSSRKESDDTTSEGHRPALVLSLACSYSVCLCVCWLALDCLSAESFPTRIRGTGRGVCVATGRVAGFCVQFLYGPLVNDDRLGRMMGLASAFAFSGMVISCRTTDTTNIDLRDHWDYSSLTKAGAALSVDGTGASLDRLDRVEELIHKFTTPLDRDMTEPTMTWHSHEHDPLLSQRRNAAAEGK